MSSSERAEQAATAHQVNDLFDALDASSTLSMSEVKQWLNRLPIAIVISKFARGEQRIVYVNKAFETLIGLSLDDIAGQGWSVLTGFKHESNESTLDDAVLKGGEDFLGTFRREIPQSLAIEAYGGLVEKEDGSENFRIVALIDVTGRQRAEREEFARRIHDRDVLLKELQHRVRNNLQLITALIRLEARDHRRGNVVNLDRLAGRIESLQLLYQALLPEGLGSDVELGSYVSQIATAVMNTYAIEGIRLNLKVDHAPMPINVAMPIGLIVNELMTNAFKYAFAGHSGGVIALECLQLGEGRYSLVVSDDGVGFPEGVQWPVEGKLGALILQTLCENADAELRFDSSPGKGTRVMIVFAHKVRERKAN